MLEIEQSFASNICRCTGYRSILSAFKRFGSDAPNKITVTDIEDLTKCMEDCKSCDQLCEDENNDWCILSVKDLNNKILKINLKDGKTFYRVTCVNDIFSVFNNEGCDSYKLICGNTAKGSVFCYIYTWLNLFLVADLKCKVSSILFIPSNVVSLK